MHESYEFEVFLRLCPTDGGGRDVANEPFQGFRNRR
jgi:hypothetical protein